MIKNVFEKQINDVSAVGADADWVDVNATPGMSNVEGACSGAVCP